GRAGRRHGWPGCRILGSFQCSWDLWCEKGHRGRLIARFGVANNCSKRRTAMLSGKDGGTMVAMDHIRAALTGIVPPGETRNIVELGMVSEIVVNGADVMFAITTE